MNPKALRNLGVAFGLAALGAAMAIALITGRPAPAPEDDAPLVAAPLPPAPAAPAASSGEAAEPQGLIATEAAAEEPPETTMRPAFLVRFAAEHDLANAEALAAQGREAEAEALVRKLVPRLRDLRGLCFERFTLGGAEIVLASCAALSPAEAQRFRERWSVRFRNMAGVAYAEPNLIADVQTGAAQN